jgi:short-subunit dehydrogenase
MTGTKSTRAVRPRLAVVTGASSGIGREYAERLGAGGYDLVLVARRRDRLEKIAADLHRSHGIDTRPWPADLTDGKELRNLEAFLETGDALDVLVNCAGFGTVAEFAVIESDRLESEIALNVTALVRLTRAALPGMLARKGGTIVNVSSMAGFQPNPYFAGYGATKAYVTNFTEAVAAEIEGSGVRLQALCPGPVRTEFGEVAGLAADVLPSFSFSTAEKVVAASLRALDKGELICVPGVAESALSAVIGIMPRWLVRRAAGALTRRMFESADRSPRIREY